MSTRIAVYVATGNERIFIGWDDEPQAAAILTQFRRPIDTVACRYCGMCHEPGTECPDLEFPGTESDQ